MGANPNQRDKLNQTPLFYAAREGHLEACKALVEGGCDPNSLDFKRQTALVYAQKNKKDEVIEYLTSLGVVPAPPEKREEKAPRKQEIFQPKKISEKTMSNYKLVFTNDCLESRDVVEMDFQQFKDTYPEVVQILLNPELVNQIPGLVEAVERMSWKHTAIKVLGNLWKTKDANIFHHPVDVKKYEIPHYFDIVKNPMDLGTVKSKLSNNIYVHPTQFIEDVDLVFHNCILFNQQESAFGMVASRLKEYFHSLLRSHNFTQFIENQVDPLGYVIQRVRQYNLENASSLGQPQSLEKPVPGQNNNQEHGL